MCNRNEYMLHNGERKGRRQNSPRAAYGQIFPADCHHMDELAHSNSDSFSLTWHLNTTLENTEDHHHKYDRPDGEGFQQVYKYFVLFFYQHNLDVSFISA